MKRITLLTLLTTLFFIACSDDNNCADGLIATTKKYEQEFNDVINDNRESERNEIIRIATEFINVAEAKCLENNCAEKIKDQVNYSQRILESAKGDLEKEEAISEYMFSKISKLECY